MTTTAPHPGPVAPRSVGAGAVARGRQETHRTPPSLLPRAASSGERHDDAGFAWPDHDAEPSRARSAAPVVASIGLLFGLAVAAAFGSRMVIEALAALLGS